LPTVMRRLGSCPTLHITVSIGLRASFIDANLPVGHEATSGTDYQDISLSSVPRPL
jgi:hypothetical protein